MNSLSAIFVNYINFCIANISPVAAANAFPIPFVGGAPQQSTRRQTMKLLTKTLMAGALLVTGGISQAADAQTLYMRADRDMTRGTEALMAGDLENASLHLSRAVRKNLGPERLVPALNNLCAVDYALGKLDSAEAACTRAVAEDRHFWRAYVNRGNVRKARGEYVLARADYEKAVRLKPASDLPKRALARLMEEQPTLMADAR
jgi:tetratricopeptide (TPR) repeat protein